MLSLSKRVTILYSVIISTGSMKIDHFLDSLYFKKSFIIALLNSRLPFPETVNENTNSKQYHWDTKYLTHIYDKVLLKR